MPQLIWIPFFYLIMIHACDYEKTRHSLYPNRCRVIMVKIQSFFYAPVVASKALPVASFLLVYVAGHTDDEFESNRDSL
jgi:hypothetical protein